MALKKFRPITPGQRHKVSLTFDSITKSKPEKSLLLKKKRTGGRNDTGKMTIENVGGGVSFTGITTANVGTGYSSGTYTDVGLYSIVGRGRNLRAQTVVFNADGTLNWIVLNTLGIQTGNGFSTGDVIGITTADVGNKGSGVRMTIRDTMDVDIM